LTSIAAAAIEAAAARTEAAATAAVIIPSTEAAATTAARGRRRSGPVELQLGRHRLAAVLRELKRAALTFTQRLHADLGQSGDVHEHIGAAVVR
jgi:hypothetical protein